MKERLLRNFKQYFPFTYAKIVDVKTTPYSELVANLSDGSTVIYDDDRNTIRALPNIETMTKDQCAKDFSIRLWKMMERRCVTQQILSERTGITQPMISGYVTGSRVPGLYNLRKIARVLKCSMDDLTYM